MLEVLVRFLQRHPPRGGWMLFLLALTGSLVLPVIVEASAAQLAAGPTVFAVLCGLILPLWGGRRARPVLIVVAVLCPLLFVGLVPPLRVVVADVQAFLARPGTAGAFATPAATSDQVNRFVGTLRTAWTGNLDALNLVIERMAALLGYVGAGVLGIGLRRARFTLGYSLPMALAHVTVGITARVDAIYIVFGIFLVLLLSVAAGFAAREQRWDRLAFGYSDSLRWDLLLGGGLLLATVFLLGFLIPATPRNALTTWVWSNLDLPPAFQALDDRRRLLGGRDRDRATAVTRQAGVELALGQSLEEGGREEVVLRVRASGLPPDARPYWRARIFERYTGSGWTTGPLETTPAEAFRPEQLPSGFVMQEVTDLRGGQRPRYGIADVVASSEPSTIERSVRGETVGWTGEAATYTVYSVLPGPIETGGPDELEVRRTLEAYRAVPEVIPTRVVELAQELARGRNTPVERAAAIENFLRGLKYSYQVEPLEPGRDAVDQFLFSMRSGYCTYYASAMALMARSVGIPSRVAVGFATGAYIADRGEYEVREEDAHAWPELYIEGQGWTRWEPTPIRPVPSRSMRADEQVATGPAAPSVAQPAVRQAQWPVFIAVLTLLALVVVVTWRSLQRAPVDASGVHRDVYRLVLQL